MSLLQEVGAQLRATSDELPTGLVTVAMERLRSATELLNWVRQSSVDPIGVPQLGNATEHAEHAAAALRLAQDAIAAYLSAIGLTGESGAAPDGDWREGLRKPPPDEPVAAPDATEPPAGQLGSWWRKRVEELTGEAPGEAQAAAESTGADTAELLRRVAGGVRSGDKARLGRDLHAVNASSGLALAAVTPPVLHRLAGDLLGHEPRAEDLARLRSAAAGRVRSLLPGAPPAVLETLLARLCRTAAPEGAQTHPADSAVTASVLTGVLLARLGRDPSTLDPAAPQPLRRPPADA
jgi:hypothetical protein